jgi:hypothetical protein
LRASAGDFEKFLHLHNPFSVINWISWIQISLRAFSALVPYLRADILIVLK